MTRSIVHILKISLNEYVQNMGNMSHCPHVYQHTELTFLYVCQNTTSCNKYLTYCCRICPIKRWILHSKYMLHLPNSFADMCPKKNQLQQLLLMLKMFLSDVIIYGLYVVFLLHENTVYHSVKVFRSYRRKFISSCG